MENSQDGSNSKGACERIFSALCPNFQANHHAHQKQDRSPPSAVLNTSLPIHDHTGYSDGIQIKLANVPGAEAAATGISRMHKAETSIEPQVKTDSKFSGLDNDAFSDYINCTKVKIRAMSSNVGMERVASRTGDVYETMQEDKSKDVFMDFVNRAKFKIRKTSSIGSRKNISFKK